MYGTPLTIETWNPGCPKCKEGDLKQIEMFWDSKKNEHGLYTGYICSECSQSFKRLRFTLIETD